MLFRGLDLRRTLVPGSVFFVVVRFLLPVAAAFVFLFGLTGSAAVCLALAFVAAGFLVFLVVLRLRGLRLGLRGSGEIIVTGIS